MPPTRIALSWSLGQFHGWGIYGLHLVFAMLRRGIQPLLLRPPNRINYINPLEQRLLLPVIEASMGPIHALANHPERTLHAPDATLLRHTDGGFGFSPIPFEAATSVGITFFETADLPPERIARARDLPLIVTGSGWNQNVLRERYQLDNTTFLMQGVDASLFFPAPRRDLLPGRFVIFSGGKLEHRKGQDLVIAAFRRFHARHPEAFLLTAWSNHWLDAGARFDARHVEGLPEANDINGWLARHLPAGSFLDIGELPNPQTPAILREAHVGLFPNRCEGGTNLVAMECMAVGLPVILADNTGHRDLIAPDRCLPLTRQDPCRHPLTGATLTDWGESSVEEMVALLEEVHAHPDRAARLGANASLFMRDFSWERQCDRFLDRLAEG
ncbi:MAG: glycosyltransferase family 4 protein [Magnetococcales bacterium]|nr:glycosyltransferase family 4 protein [Magnetococcales bacterium]